MFKVLTVFGTRPEAIKMAPVVKALQGAGSQLVCRICVTAQHREMLDQVLQLFEITPDHDLDIMKPSQNLFELTIRVLQGLKTVIALEQPDIILVHGDTTTAMAASLAAYYSRIPLGHVEAGLRTYNKNAPFPEEINRRVAGLLSDIHFAPTERARQNLLQEGVPAAAVHVTGNTVVDALFAALHRMKSDPAMAVRLEEQFGFLDPSRRLILVTGHRRENFGDGFEQICRALATIAAERPDIEILYPVHLNPNVREPVLRILSGCSNIHLIEPVDYLPFVYLMNRSYMIITDSGGVQEEAPSLGKPVLVMRAATERPEALEAGTVLLVGADGDRIIRETYRLLDDSEAYEKMGQILNPYGDGAASGRISDILVKRFNPSFP